MKEQSLSDLIQNLVELNTHFQTYNADLVSEFVAIAEGQVFRIKITEVK